MTSLKVFKKIVQRQIFNCQEDRGQKKFLILEMTEEPTMASVPRKLLKESMHKNRLAADRESKKRKRAKESQEQHRKQACG